MYIAETASNIQPAKINELVKDLNECMFQNKIELKTKNSMLLVIDNSERRNRLHINNVTINGETLRGTTTSKLLGEYR